VIISNSESDYKKMLDKIFKLKENNTTVKQEAVAGITTFATISYIIFVQPAVLSAAGMDLQWLQRV